MRRSVGDDKRLILVEHKAAVEVAGVAGRPAEVDIWELVWLGELVCRVDDSQRMSVIDAGARPKACSGRVERPDLPGGRAYGQGIGLRGASHRHRRLRRRSQLERKASMSRSSSRTMATMRPLKITHFKRAVGPADRRPEGHQGQEAAEARERPRSPGSVAAGRPARLQGRRADTCGG